VIDHGGTFAKESESRSGEVHGSTYADVRKNKLTLPQVVWKCPSHKRRKLRTGSLVDQGDFEVLVFRANTTRTTLDSRNCLSISRLVELDSGERMFQGPSYPLTYKCRSVYKEWLWTWIPVLATNFYLTEEHVHLTFLQEHREI
jgi:hypothetical protein